MRLGFGVALLLVASFSGSAFADNIVSVGLTGTQPDGTSPLSSSFSLNLNNSTNDGFIYTFTDPNATVDGFMEPVTVKVSQSLDGNTLELIGTMLDETFDFAANGMTPFFDPSVPTFNAGMYNGLDLSNFNPAQLSATTVTPEPSSIALVATGLLGVGGMMRRRYSA